MSSPLHEHKAAILKAMAHPDRVAILEYLRENKICACDMAPTLGIRQSSFSRHISSLKAAGVLKTWKEGVRLFFDVSDPCVYDILEHVNSLLELKVKAQQQVLSSRSLQK